MCGRYTLKSPASSIERQFKVEISQAIRPGMVARYNIPPGSGVLTVFDDRDAGWRKADFFHWGLVPKWAQDVSIAHKLSNARSGTVREKPSFRDAYRYRRCLIPADGFYEWKRQGSQPRPYYFEVDEGALFAMAGLWEHWQSPDGSEILSCTVLTTGPNETMRPIHHRLPVILDPRDYDRWLDPGDYHGSQLTDLFEPLAADRMRCREVSPLVNNARNEGPELIAAVEPSPLPPDPLEFDFGTPLQE